MAAAGGPVSSWADRRFGGFATSGLAGQFAIGLSLGAVRSPRVGPDARRSVAAGVAVARLPQVALTMVVFDIGAALPLVALGLLSRATLTRVRSRLMSAGKLGKGALGAAFIIIGVAIVSGTDKRIEAVLVAASPQRLTELRRRSRTCCPPGVFSTPAASRPSA